MSICDNCDYKVNCAMLPEQHPVNILVECKLFKECFEINFSSMCLTVKEGAKLLKKVLKTMYPKYKWSVTGSHYAGGNSIRVNYTDPDLTDANYVGYLQRPNIYNESREISDLCDTFQEGNFNGMTDSYDFAPGRLGCTNYVFATRRAIEA